MPDFPHQLFEFDIGRSDQLETAAIVGRRSEKPGWSKDDGFAPRRGPIHSHGLDLVPGQVEPPGPGS